MSNFVPSPDLDVESVIQLGDGNVDLRCRVDRRLFESFCNGEDVSGTGVTLTNFMNALMLEHHVSIYWPSKLRQCVRSKKDPHVRIVGAVDNVNIVRDRILTVMDTRRSRITLKIDVSFLDHSHVIGKGGRTIQTVMDDTGCHIHFPDSNRTNTFEKSNQVSIAGSAEGAERARCRIRNLQPITVIYDIDFASLAPLLGDQWSTIVQSVQRNFGLVVSMKTMRGPFVYSVYGNSTDFVRVAVRGTRSHVLGLRQGITELLELITNGKMAFNNTPVNMETEIAAQHHSFVMGRGSCNIRNIMMSTGTVIKLPEGTSMMSGMAAPAASSLPMKRSTVVIAGSNFDAVYKAWEELLSCLPLLLIFDLREGQELDTALITQLMEKLKVSILIKPKQKQNLKSIMVRGPEKDSRVLFEVRRQIMGLGMSEVPYCCDKHYWNQYSNTLIPPSLLSGLGANVPRANGVSSTKAVQPADQDLSWRERSTSIVEKIKPVMPEADISTMCKLVARNLELNRTIGGSAVPKLSYPLGFGDAGMMYDWKPFEPVMKFTTPSDRSSTTTDDTTPESGTTRSDSVRRTAFPDINGTDDLFTPSLAAENLDFTRLRRPQPQHNHQSGADHYLAARKRDEDISKPRTPTTEWRGFSRTLPTETLAQMKRREMMFLREEETDRASFSSFLSTTSPWCPTDQDSKTLEGGWSEPQTQEPNFSNSDYFTAQPNVRHMQAEAQGPDNIDLVAILTASDLSHYLPCLEKLTFKQFLHLKEQDLIKLGINLTSGRYKVLTTIMRMRVLFSKYYNVSGSNADEAFDSAPGAGRKKL